MTSPVSLYLVLWLFLSGPAPQNGPSPAAIQQDASTPTNARETEPDAVGIAGPPSQPPTALEPAIRPPATGNAATVATEPLPRAATAKPDSEPVATETSAATPTTPEPVVGMPAAGNAIPETNHKLPDTATAKRDSDSVAAEHSAPTPPTPSRALESTEQAPSISNGSWWPWLGWLLSLLLVLYLIRAQAGWRTAFENKEWLLLPSERAAHMTDVLQRLVHSTGGLESSLSGSTQSHRKGVESLSHAIHDTRAEFAILREELDRKTREIADLKLGHEFHARRPVLRAVAHALQIIEEATHSGEPSESTLAGVATELRECLEDNRVIARSFEPGTKLAEAKGVSTQESIREPAADASMKGTIGETLRCAYVVMGPSGAEDIVRPARVRIYT